MKSHPICRLCRLPRLQHRCRYSTWDYSQHSCHWSAVLCQALLCQALLRRRQGLFRHYHPDGCPPASWRMKPHPLCRLCRSPKLQRRQRKKRTNYSQHSCHWSAPLRHRFRPDRPPCCPPASWRMKQYPLCRLCCYPRLQRPWHLPYSRRYPSRDYSQHNCHWSTLLRHAVLLSYRFQPDRSPENRSGWPATCHR